MNSLLSRLRRLRKEILGLNRRNHDYMIPYNPAPLVALVDNKLATKHALERCGLPLPATFATCTQFSQLHALGKRLRNLSDFVIKPAHGAGGEGIVVVVGRVQDRWLRASGEPISERDLLAHAADVLAGAFSLSQCRDEVFVEERLELHPALRKFAFAGVADVRVVVVHGVPLCAMVRLPTRESDGRANLHLGGVGVGVDLASGRGTHAVWHGRSVLRHPDTDAVLADLEVPYWPDILNLSAQCFDAVPLGYFGVDLVVDATHGPRILELNARPGLAIQLANRRGLRPLLEALRQKPPAPATPAAERVQLGCELATRR